jgi:hypothetical protein
VETSSERIVKDHIVKAGRAGAAFYTPSFGIFGGRFFHPGDGDGAVGVVLAILYYGRAKRVLSR